MNGPEELGACIVQCLCSLIIGHLVGLLAEAVEGNVGSEVDAHWRQSLELVERGHDEFVWVALSDLSLGIDLVERKVAWPMEVDVGVEEIAAEAIHLGGEVLGDMSVAELLANDAAVLAFDQGVVVGVARARAGELDAEFLQQPGHVVIDVLAAAVGVKTQDLEGKAGKELADHRQ